MVELLLLVGGGLFAGAWGALLGVGGGLQIVPLLTFGFGLPFREAVGASLVCVIATSSAAAAVYLQRDLANLRLGMTLELFTAIAALVGGLAAFLLPDRVLALLFAALLTYVAFTMARAARRPAAPPESTARRASTARPESAAAPAPAARSALPREDASTPGAARHAASGSYLESLSGPGYTVRNLRRGIGGSLLAGLVSALFGIGGGIVKVPVMNLIMGVPLRVSAATSNLMIGVTASSGAIVYLFRGGVDAYVAGPTALGVYVGASVASRLAHRVDVRLLRWLFVAVLVYSAVRTLLTAIS